MVHGHQQLSLFNAHYDERCFLPIHVYDTATGRPVAMILRPGKTPSGVEVRGRTSGRGGCSWRTPSSATAMAKANTFDQLDERAAWFYEAVVISKAMLTQTPGVGQRYIAAYKDADGGWLSGEHAYVLHVSVDPPREGLLVGHGL